MEDVQLKPDLAEPARDTIQFDKLCEEFNDTIAANKDQLDDLGRQAIELTSAFKEQVRLTEALQQLRA